MECNEITNNIDFLKTRFLRCRSLFASDLQLLLEILEALDACDDGSTGPGVGDNLGNHIATTNLNLSSKNIVNVNKISASIFSPNVGDNISLEPNGTGVVTVNNSRISEALNPIENQDVATKIYVDSGLATKQNLLVSGVTIKTINGESILGSGNITTASETIKEEFTATDNQTDFNIAGSPSDLLMVFTGRNMALENVDYQYTSGTLTFNTGLIVGTKVKVIF